MQEVAVPRYAIPAQRRRWVLVSTTSGVGILVALVAADVSLAAQLYSVTLTFGAVLGYSTLWSP